MSYRCTVYRGGVFLEKHCQFCLDKSPSPICYNMENLGLRTAASAEVCTQHIYRRTGFVPSTFQHNSPNVSPVGHAELLFLELGLLSVLLHSQTKLFQHDELVLSIAEKWNIPFLVPFFERRRLQYLSSMPLLQEPCRQLFECEKAPCAVY